MGAVLMKAAAWDLFAELKGMSMESLTPIRMWTASHIQQWKMSKKELRRSMSSNVVVISDGGK